MKPALPILTLIATIAVTEATDPSAIINLKSQIGNLALNAATSVIQAKQNLIQRSTAAIINAKTNFIQRQLPHFVRFKSNQINGVLELKKNLLKSKVATPSQLTGGGNAVQAAEQDVAPYSPPGLPAAPPAPIEQPLTPYIPQPSLPPQAPPLPAQIPEGPYPPPAYLAKRQQLRREQTPVASEHAQASFHPKRELYQPIYSRYPTPPPPPPTRHILYV